MPERLLEAACPSHVPRQAGSVVDLLVFHDSGTRNAAQALAQLRAGSGLGCHYLIDQEGTIWRAVPENRAARHAGEGSWRGRRNLDASSIAIALVQTGPEAGPRDYGLLQLAALCDLCLELIGRHRIPARNIVGQSDLDPARARGPSERLDWDQLARNGVGLYPSDVPDLGTTGPVRDAVRLRDVRRALADIGYGGVAPEGGLDPALSAVLRSFQRHWRPEAVNGQADSGTLARLLAVARLVAAG
jgi:N-acetylmuramoyl-L-alanine amidase